MWRGAGRPLSCSSGTEKIGAGAGGDVQVTPHGPCAWIVSRSGDAAWNKMAHNHDIRPPSQSSPRDNDTEGINTSPETQIEF